LVNGFQVAASRWRSTCATPLCGCRASCRLSRAADIKNLSPHLARTTYARH